MIRGNGIKQATPKNRQFYGLLGQWFGGLGYCEFQKLIQQNSPRWEYHPQKYM